MNIFLFIVLILAALSFLIRFVAAIVVLIVHRDGEHIVVPETKISKNKYALGLIEHLLFLLATVSALIYIYNH